MCNAVLLCKSPRKQHFTHRLQKILYVQGQYVYVIVLLSVFVGRTFHSCIGLVDEFGDASKAQFYNLGNRPGHDWHACKDDINRTTSSPVAVPRDTGRIGRVDVKVRNARSIEQTFTCSDFAVRPLVAATDNNEYT